MKSTTILSACLTMGVVMTGCEKARNKHEAPATQVAPVTVPRDPEVAARIRKEVGGILKKSPDSIKVTDAFVRDLGADSLDTVEIVMATEEAFGITIDDKDAEKLITVGDLIDYVTARIKDKPAGTKKAMMPKNNAGLFAEPAGEPIKVETKFVEITSGTEELSFDWIVNPFTDDTTPTGIKQTPS